MGGYWNMVSVILTLLSLDIAWYLKIVIFTIIIGGWNVYNHWDNYMYSLTWASASLTFRASGSPPSEGPSEEPSVGPSAAGPSSSAGPSAGTPAPKAKKAPV